MDGECLNSLPDIMLLNLKQGIDGSFSFDSDGLRKFEEALATSCKSLNKRKKGKLGCFYFRLVSVNRLKNMGAFCCPLVDCYWPYLIIRVIRPAQTDHSLPDVLR